MAIPVPHLPASDRKDGGSAFPGLVSFDPNFGHVEGMTLRDWFAGQAMSAIIIGNNADISALRLGAAIDAYAAADALLAARGK